jgi:hypothetical protein
VYEGVDSARTIGLPTSNPVTAAAVTTTTIRKLTTNLPGRGSASGNGCEAGAD